MWHCVGHDRTDVSEECVTSIFRVDRIHMLRMLAVAKRPVDVSSNKTHIPEYSIIYVLTLAFTYRTANPAKNTLESLLLNNLLIFLSDFT
jgi:hypothetical protein